MIFRNQYLIILPVLLAVTAVAGAGDDSKPPVRAGKPNAAKKQRKLPPLTKEAKRVAADLKKKLPPKSEGRLMLDSVLSGRVGPNDGWFRVAKVKTRFDWKYAAKTFDRDQDAEITEQEFGGDKADFRRLDRNRDGVLTVKDFDFSAGPMSRTPGAMLFYRADRDGNGHVTKKEFAALFDSFDSGKLGFLSLDDLNGALQPPARRRGGKRSGRPSTSLLVQALAKQELGALHPGPGLNAKAPDFTLQTVDGGKTITLSDEIGDKPVVLIFGSFT